MHINQFIAHAGVCARRRANQLIKDGKIAVNGDLIRDLSYRVQPDDIVTYQGKVLRPEGKRYILLHKPAHYLTTVYDPQGRRTVMALLEEEDSTRVYPVGRLDYLTTGLLILTNDGYLASKLAHPSRGVQKRYEVTLDRPLHSLHFKQVKQGVRLRDGVVPVDGLRMLHKRDKVEITLHVGRNRIIRRLFASLGYEVVQLMRTGYADLTLKGLAEGKWRFLSKEEVKHLREVTTRRTS